MSYKCISKRHLRRKVKLNSKLAWKNIKDFCDTANNISNAHDKILTDSPTFNSEFDVFDTTQTSDISPVHSTMHHSHNDASIMLIDVLDEVDENKIEKELFINNLRTWAHTYNVTHMCLNGLIALIRNKYPFLPKDSRSVLKTPRSVSTIPLENGNMIYIGIKNALKKKIESGISFPGNHILLQWNVDGIPIFKSSSLEFWPILGKCSNVTDKHPFCIAIFCGKGKPAPLNVYLHEFVLEQQDLVQNGLVLNSQQYTVGTELFTCDAPARAFLKMITGHTSTYACERCKIKSVFIDKKHFFPIGKRYEKRKDSDFYLPLSNENHIKDKSPLLQLHIGLISQFALDPMHLIYLGVMRRLLLKYVVEGKRPFKLSKHTIAIMNKEISSFKIPSEFGRKIRPLIDIRRWKATEFRFFLLYCGVICLKNKMNDRAFSHFLLLHVSCFILCSKHLCQQLIDVAEKYIIQFVDDSAKIYDQYFVSYNVHSLIHICEDVRNFGNLDSFACFPFENMLGKLKKIIRSKKLPLQQIHNRLHEITMANSQNSSLCRHTSIAPKNVYDPNKNVFRCTELQMAKYKLTLRKPNNIVLVGKKLFTITSFYTINGKYRCTGKSFRYMHDIYEYPMKSSKLDIYYASGEGQIENFAVSDIKFKCISFPYKRGLAVFPIVHLHK